MNSEALDSILNHLTDAAQSAAGANLPVLGREILIQHGLASAMQALAFGMVGVLALLLARLCIQEGNAEKDSAKQDTKYVTSAIIGLIGIMLMAGAADKTYRLLCCHFAPNAVLFDHVNQLKGNR